MKLGCQNGSKRAAKMAKIGPLINWLMERPRHRPHKHIYMMMWQCISDAYFSYKLLFLLDHKHGVHKESCVWRAIAITFSSTPKCMQFFFLFNRVALIAYFSWDPLSRESHASNTEFSTATTTEWVSLAPHFLLQWSTQRAIVKGLGSTGKCGCLCL